MTYINTKEIAPILKVLGDETRLCIVSLLYQQPLCACDLLEHFHITQPTLSYHMKQLTTIGLVMANKEGQWVKYTLNKERYAQVHDFFTMIGTCCHLNKKQ